MNNRTRVSRRAFGTSILVVATLAGCVGVARSSPTGSVQLKSPSPSSAPPSIRPSGSPALALDPGSVIVVCGGGPSPIARETCLRLAGASLELDPDLGNATKITVTLLDPEPGLASSPPEPIRLSAGSATIEITWSYLPSYLVRVESPDGQATMPLYLAADGVGTGRAPAQARTYNVRGDLAAWTEPMPFSLDAGTFTFDAGCLGSAARLAGGTVHLERLTSDGRVDEDHRVTCGPAAGGDMGSVQVGLEAGSYRVRVEGVTRGLQIDISPQASR